MELKKNDGRRDAGRPDPTIFYRDYIVSTAWELRKKQYYERHAKVCKICGATTNVQLNHIKYGNYGRERDFDLVPLCGDHHEALHAKLGVSRNMHYKTEHFIADMQAAWDAEHEDKPLLPQRVAKSSPSSVAIVLDKMTRPIWRLIYMVVPRK